MKNSAFHILRVGIGITFLWIGVLIFKDPAAWGGYVQSWAVRLLPFSVEQAMVGTALLDVGVGFFLLIDVLAWLAALVAVVHLVIVLTVSGINAITVRDIGLLAGAIALVAHALPSSLRFWQKRNN